MLEGKVILITGATGGIGFAAAKACAKAGAHVILHGRSREEAKEKLSELKGEHAYVLGSLEKAETLNEIVQASSGAFGRLDGLVNNAGISPRSTIHDVTVEDFDFTFAVNIKAPLLLTHYAVQEFRKTGGGAVVNIGSINAWCGAHNLLIYSASKGALMTVTRNLGHALGGENIRVNQLNVGWTWTPNEHKLQIEEGRPENWTEQIPKAFAPSGHILQPEQVASHIVFWLSDLSSPVTGQVYEVEQYPLLGRTILAERSS